MFCLINRLSFFLFFFYIGVNLRTSTAIKRQNNADASKAYPCTPPPSPSGRRCSAEISNEDNLVHITMVMYGKDSIPFQENKVSFLAYVNIFIN